jgi:hypothetical protein
LLFSADACDSAIVVQRSRDVGATWTSPVAVSSFTDDCNRVFGKPRIVTDTFAGSLHQGRVYVLWDDAIIDPSQSDSTTGGLVSDRQTVSFSDDSGRTWSAPAHLSPPTSLDQVITFARPVVQSDGAVTDVYSSWDFSQDPNNPDQHVFAQTSHNGGSTWTPRVDVSGAVQGFGFPDIIDGGPGVAATTWDPVKHKMYAVWTDSRYRSPGENDILMSTSTNGLVWSSPRRVNVDKVTSDTNHTTPDVAADNGKVFVSYRTRDHESSGNTRLINFVLASSFDGGSTFAVRAIGPQSDITYAATTDGGFAYPGHYSGSAAANGRLYTAWAVSGARGAQTTHQSVYAATFTT